MKSFIAFIFLFLSINVDGQQKDSLQVGDIAPSFSGYDQDSTHIISDSLLFEKKIVLIFYRGAWCPYCKRHLSSLQDSISLIKANGAEVIVVTPEKYESQEKMIEKTGATYSIIYDEAYQIMKAFNVEFKISEETVLRYLPFVKTKTRKANENDDDILPIPATYVIGKGGKILFQHFDEDYRERSTIKEILNAL